MRVLDEALEVFGGAGLFAQEGGQVARHGRVLGKGQPDLGQAPRGRCAGRSSTDTRGRSR
jgi:hypothetical protein